MSENARPPRENLVRARGTAPELVRDVDTPDAMPTLSGHFAVWDTWTEIRSAYEGHFLERFAPGSMSKTIAEGRDRMRVLFQHGKDPQIGDKPLGPISVLEPDATGARYEVPLLDTAYNRDLIPGLDAGLYGASFRFQVISEHFDQKPARSTHNPDGLPERTVTEAKVLEFGPVTFPAYANATAGLRSMTDEYLFGRMIEDPERAYEMLEQQRQLRSGISFSNPGSGGFWINANTTTASSGSGAIVFREAQDEAHDKEPEPPEATTPPDDPEVPDEPEPPEATTPEPGETPTPRFTDEEWLTWISRT